MVLEMRRGNRKYSVHIEERIVCVSGNSGKGKTVFVDDLKYILDNIRTTRLNNLTDVDNAVGDYIYCDVPINIPRDIRDVEDFYRVNNNTWMIVDEDFSGIGKPYTNNIIHFSDIKFLFVTREDKLSKISFGMNSLYEIITDNNVIKLSRQINIKRFVKVGYDDSIYPCIITEDKTDGKALFKLYTKGMRVESSDGKDNIVSKINELPEVYKINPIIVAVDSCAFGSSYNKVRLELESKGYSIVINDLYESFEKLVLDAFIAEDTIYAEIAGNIHKEDRELVESLYTRRLSSVVEYRFNIPYTKNSIPSLLLLKSVYENFIDKFYFIPKEYIVNYNDIIGNVLNSAVNYCITHELCYKLSKPVEYCIKQFPDNADPLDIFILDLSIDNYINESIKYNSSIIGRIKKEFASSIDIIQSILRNNGYSIDFIKSESSYIGIFQRNNCNGLYESFMTKLDNKE